MDLCGFPKTAYWLHRAQWVDDRPLLDLAPHWNWAGREGEPITVMAMTNVERVALFLNGRPLGEKAVDRFEMPRWQVPWASGRLEAVGYLGGRRVAHALVETTGAPVALRLTPDRTVMAGDGEDAQPVTVDAVDARGRHVPTAQLPVRLAISGGTIIGLGNGDPNSHEPEKGDSRKLFNGLAQVIVRADSGAGPLRLTAQAEDLRTGQVSIARVATTPRAQVAPTPSVQTLEGWRQSPASPDKPDPMRKPIDSDMNSWLWLGTGQIEAAQGEGNWISLRATFVARRRVQANGGILRFGGIVGRAEIWLDGRKVAEKPDFTEASLDVAVPASSEEHVVTLLVESRPGLIGGLSQPATVGAR
jgi:beta-galactosidase